MPVRATGIALPGHSQAICADIRQYPPILGGSPLWGENQGFSLSRSLMKILLVKLSSLGDVVHTLPVVHDIHAAMPDARIDWVLEKSFAPLLSRLVSPSVTPSSMAPLIPSLPVQQPVLNRVIACELRRWRGSPWSAATRREWRAFKAQLQLEAYDAVIDLQGLTKSALVARLARMAPGGKRFAMANKTEGSGYEAPTRWAADVAVPLPAHIHAVQRSRELAARALGYTFAASPDFGLKVPVALTLGVGAAMQNIADESPLPTVALVHGTSRADKEWPLDHWIALGRRLQASGYRIALTHGNDQELLTSQAIAQALLKAEGGTPVAASTGSGPKPTPGQRRATRDLHGAAEAAVVWPMLSLSALIDALEPCAGVIGVDSGVSHIAVALELPHVQIYNFDTAWRTGPVSDPRQLSVFAQPTPSVDMVCQAWQQCTAAGGVRATA
jgi:heptosyltransferase I